MNALRISLIFEQELFSQYDRRFFLDDLFEIMPKDIQESEREREKGRDFDKR